MLKVIWLYYKKINVVAVLLITEIIIILANDSEIVKFIHVEIKNTA